MKQRTPAPEFRTVPETADALKLGKSTVYRLIIDGKIRGVRIGGSIRVPNAELERLQRGEAVS